MRKIFLASTSPRRRELMDSFGIAYEILSPEFDEDRMEDCDPVVYASVSAYQKAYSIFRHHPDDIVIAADTIVVLEGKILGKPASREEGAEMLRALSGRTHQVLTGQSILSLEEKRADTFLAEVTFKDLTFREIEQYLDTGEYQDKAGSYAIQGVGGMLVSHFEGDIETIIGMPTAPIEEFLKRNQIDG